MILEAVGLDTMANLGKRGNVVDNGKMIHGILRIPGCLPAAALFILLVCIALAEFLGRHVRTRVFPHWLLECFEVSCS